MEEIVVKLDVPKELEPKLKLALTKVVKQLVRDVRFALLDEIMSKSELTDEQIKNMLGR